MRYLIFILLVLAACNKEPSINPSQGTSVSGPEEAHPFCKSEKENDISTRSLTGQTLIVEITTDSGSPALLADSCVQLLDTNVQPFWNSTLCPNADECPMELTGNVTSISYTASGTPPSSYPGSIDWFEQNGLFPALEANNLSLSSFDVVFVLVPPGVYGWEGLYNFSKVVWLNTRLVNFSWGQILAHELGHHVGLGHSSSQNFLNCNYNSFITYGGEDVMGGTYRSIAPNFLFQLGILTETSVPLMPVGDTVMVWVPNVEDNAGIRYGNSWRAYYRPSVNKVIVMDGATVRQRITAVENTTYITNNNVKVIIGKDRQGYSSIGVDPECVNALGEGEVVVTLIQLGNQCN